jgi:methionyl-tRNA synthetase
MKNTLYITTTIPYVNAPPHVGFALELVQADAIARYHRLAGRHVRLQTGTDENAFKNVLSARERGLPVQQLVDRNAAQFRTLARALHISHDTFVRTTDPAHVRAVTAFLTRLRPEDVYVKAYRGLYCSGCEDFFLERELTAGLCPEHHTPVTEVNEQNHFFRLSAYAETLGDRIRSGQISIVPQHRASEVLQFVDRGLQDISISRAAARSAGWGIPFPGDSTQVVYVWIDALINYLTGLGFPDSDSAFWSDGAIRLHVIGKNVWKFHAVYWPALLLSAGLQTPSQIFVHGFLTNNGEKISKSGTNAIDPMAILDRYGADALRYFLLRHVRPSEDADFSVERLRDVYQTELANGLGNLYSRLTKLAETANLSGLHERQRAVPPPEVRVEIEAFHFDRALALLWDEVDALNREIAAAQPWLDLRNARDSLQRWLERLANLADWLEPFLPSTAARIGDGLRAPQIRKAAPLFPR